MKILHLHLKKEWYDMINSGEKPEEYREDKKYWCKIFLNTDYVLFSYRNGYQSCNVNNYTHVLFYYGYTNKTMLFEINDIVYGYGNPKWGAPKDKKVFIIKLGKLQWVTAS